ncbi:CACTA en-spm transposon protein [Cucumis melo var. makuwa]|uniref:CACTA en-spm transposon protein n=1 Tax=Cucumis melo var. makuwa TaxID=1194695 RepID=A0A5D3CT84_CUCMM|nr:CACTA en-spm transposon protein [Cucumis melo var. makuwa]
MGMNNCHINAEQATMNDHDKQRTMSSFPSGFKETDAMFLEFTEDLNNLERGSSSRGDNSVIAQPSPTLTSRRHAQSQLLGLERYIQANGKILMLIALGTEKPILPHAVRFSQAITVCIRKKFLVRYLRFDEHHMLITFKEFRGDCHRHFKKYSDPEEARATHHTYWWDVTKDVHNQILELQSQPIPDGSQSFSGITYARLYWVDDQAILKALVGDLRPSPIRQPVQPVPRPRVYNLW